MPLNELAHIKVVNSRPLNAISHAVRVARMVLVNYTPPN